VSRIITFFNKLIGNNMFNDLVTRHKEAVWAVQRKFNLSDYALLWVAFAEGVVITLLFLAIV